MIRVAISVEGQTEDEFCRQVLSPYLRHRGICLIPIIITTKRENCGIKHKGGCINLTRVQNELKKLLHNFDFVTTFYDLYGFDIVGDPTADQLESMILNLFQGHNNLIPYIQKYEFETLLFSNSSYFKEYFNDTNAQKVIDGIIHSCGSVEDINNSKETAPSKRLENFFDQYDEQYDKVFHGPLISDDIGLDQIRKVCLRFNAWLLKLEQLVIK